ncbi:MAG: haloacid dehalogenase-like hydrolase [Carboxylicivirga sp.]|nr:haloacid dehalogenase-like hydrolase [Carboxylicivirga sp.]
MRIIQNFFLLAFVLVACNQQQLQEAPALTSWNDGNAKQQIVNFIEQTTSASSADFIEVKDRIAVFDMDGTILLEKPHYVLFDFAVREMNKRMHENPELTNKQPFKAIAEEDWNYFKTVGYMAETGIYSVLLYATDGFTNDQYQSAVNKYFDEVIDERFKQSYKKLVYKPMLELVAYLQHYQYQVYIVSGSDPQFTRSFCEEAIGIPVNKVIGSTVLTKFEEEVGQSSLVRQHEFIQPINDEAGKPVNILNKIGKVPVIAIGNSKGDYHMLQYSKNAPISLQMLVNHDDSIREYKYNHQELSELCREKDWVEISMEKDFAVIF